ncbi:MAG: complex I NDUFA9 subunit family protein [Alcaligenaceae bacterium]|nr:complex I NDUFA9 subunit family protein [Alcaligenaceae bacterium]
MRVLVIGGTGFIGQHLVARLVAEGHQVVVPTRRYRHARELLPLPTVTVQQSDVHDDAQLNALVLDAEAVVNLVGVLHSRPGQPYGPDFKRAHVDLPARIATACLAGGVKHLVHISALGASATGSSGYARSKAAGEAAIRDALQGKGVTFSIIQPSVVFGPEDNFMNLFAGLSRVMPVMLLAGAGARLQPVYVGDVVKAITTCLVNPLCRDKTYPLGGPQVFTLGMLVALAARWAGHPRPVVALPWALGYAQARLFECLPGPPLMSRDNLDSLKTDNVLVGPLAPELGIVPTPLEAVAPGYLGRRLGPRS